MKVRLNKRARQQLREIRLWYRQKGSHLPARFTAEFDRLCRRLTAFPYSGMRIEGDVRRAGLAVFPYLVFYLIEGEWISIISVVHTHRHPDAWQQRT